VSAQGNAPPTVPLVCMQSAYAARARATYATDVSTRALSCCCCSIEDTSKYTATSCNALQLPCRCWVVKNMSTQHMSTHTGAHCNIPQLTTTHCNTLQHTAPSHVQQEWYVHTTKRTKSSREYKMRSDTESCRLEASTTCTRICTYVCTFAFLYVYTQAYGLEASAIHI